MFPSGQSTVYEVNLLKETCSRTSLSGSNCQWKQAQKRHRNTLKHGGNTLIKTQTAGNETASVTCFKSKLQGINTQIVEEYIN